MRKSVFVFLALFLLVSGSHARPANMWQVDPPTMSKWKELHLRDPRLTSFPAESIHSFNVLHYTLDIDFAMSTSYIEGASTVLCETREAGLDSILLYCAGLSVDSVLFSGSKQLLFNLAGGNLYIDLDTVLQPYDTFEVSVFYHGYPSSGYYWYGTWPNMPETTAYTSTEPSDSRYWFPCFDEPWDKADMGCNINARVPLGFVVASNGLLTAVDTVGGTHAVYRWQEDYSIATYLMSVAITKYVQILDEYVNSLGDTIPVQHFVYQEDSSLAVMNFGDTPEMMEFFSSVFGEYPFEKYGMAVVQPFWGGMEHQTMTTILRSAAVNGWEMGVAHELAHMWWGDMVTCFIWEDIWVNEGFATFSEALWTEYKYGYAAYQANMWSKGYYYFLQDSSERFPIYDPTILFNWGIVYCKGAWVLHMLRHMTVSDSVFFAMLTDFGDTYKFGNATTDDVSAKAAEFYGSSLDWYFQQWVYDQGHPQYEYGWNSTGLGGGAYEVRIQIQQIQTNAPAVFEMPVDIEIQTAAGDTTIVVWNDAVYQTFTDTLFLASAPTGISFDPENWVLDEHWEVPFNGVAEQTPSRRAHAALRASPNPFSKSVTIILPTTPTGVESRFEIYDISGRMVKSFSYGAAQQASMVWEGLDNHNRPVPSGIYFARVSNRTSTESLKLIKLE